LLASLIEKSEDGEKMEEKDGKFWQISMEWWDSQWTSQNLLDWYLK
jgi:hypothetical protein